MNRLCIVGTMLLSSLFFIDAASAADFNRKAEARPMRETPARLHRVKPVNINNAFEYPAIIDPAAERPTQRRADTPTEETEMLTVLYEDFSAFTAGSEDAPDEARVDDAWGEIPAQYTITPGWEGGGVRQAGGSAFLDWYEYTSSFDGVTYTLAGYLATPPTDLSLNYGKTYLSFRVRSLEPEGGYFYVTWDTNYSTGNNDEGTTGGSKQLGTYGVWGQFEYIELPDCTDDCVIEFYSPGCHLFLDDIRVEKVKPAVFPPVVRRWTNYDDSGDYTTFRANWDPVEGADAYEFHVYRYYDDGIYTKKVVKETNVTDTFFDVTEKNKLDRNYTYYYYVRAKKGTELSEESSVAMVFDVMTPEINGVSDVDASGYTASWNPVFNADGYGFFSFLYHKADKDETYYFLDEDFSTITSDGTPENPSVSIIGQDYLDDYGISRANWMLYEGAFIDGAVGMHVYTMSNGDVYYGELDSPILVLGASDRKITVTADYISPDGVEPVIFLACPVTDDDGKTAWGFVDEQPVKGVGAEWSTKTVTLTATSSLCKIAISLNDTSGNFYFIDNIRMSQNLKAGEYISLPYTYTEFDENGTEYRDLTPDHLDGDTYSFSVYAAREIPGSSWFKQYITSEESDYYDVPAVTSDGLRSVVADGDKGFRLRGDVLSAAEGARVYGIDGSLFTAIAPGASATLPAGLWIVSTPAGAAKINVK